MYFHTQGVADEYNRLKDLKRVSGIFGLEKVAISIVSHRFVFKMFQD